MFIYSIPFIAFWFSSVSGMPQRMRLTNRRPFSCPKCMGFWLMALYQLQFTFTINTVLTMCLSSLSAWAIEVICIKLKIPFNR